MKTVSVIISLAAFVSIAYAGGAGRTTREMGASPEREPPRSRDMPITLPSSTPCDPPLAQSWFSAVCRPLAGCPASQQLDTSAYQTLTFADVNDDGVMDYFTVLNGLVVFDGAPAAGCLLIKSDMVADGENYSESLVCVGEMAPVSAAVLQRYPNARTAFINQWGWRDVDGDGDLDLRLNVNVEFASGSAQFQCWLQNVGYEREDPPVAADLNQDGTVDGNDLGLLLAAWGT